MRYELAKELKDAGFLQADPNQAFNVGTFQYIGDNSDRETLCYIPTLSELIEACGNNFSDLGRNDDTWFCNNEGAPYVHVDWDECKTPEEAVAKLWLALNKK